MATTASRDQNPGSVQQQQQQQHGAAASADARLSRTEMNVLKTMIAVIICFIVCWSVFAFANLFMLLRASSSTHYLRTPVLCGIHHTNTKYAAEICGNH